jgi:transposase-like protein
MIPVDFKIYYLSLSPTAQQELVQKILELSMDKESVLNMESNKRVKCPHCGDSHLVGCGKSNKGVQRYLCRSCERVSCTYTGKVWYRIHKKDKLSAFIHCLLSGYSVRKSAQEVGISNHTAFMWRHKFLTSFSAVSAQSFSGIVESDETYFLYSEKGKKDLKRPPRKRGRSATRDGINDEHVAVIVTTDRNGNQAAKVIKRGRIKTKDVQSVLKNKISKDSVLCTDGHPSYAGFTKREKIEHKKIIASQGKRVIERHYHLQNVNSLDSRMKKFINSFNGVSTKYLQNYLNWFLVLEHVKNTNQKFKKIVQIATNSTLVWYEFKNLILNNTQIST